jgi:5-methylcytosine-specific restriction endonuclease McrA
MPYRPHFSPFYVAYMQSPEWRLYRDAVKARDGYRCVRCGSRRHLEVDHKTYERLGHEKLSDCQALCHRCHTRVTRQRRRARRGARGRLLRVVLRVVVLLGILVAVMYLR